MICKCVCIYELTYGMSTEISVYSVFPVTTCCDASHGVTFIHGLRTRHDFIVLCKDLIKSLFIEKFAVNGLFHWLELVSFKVK